MSMSRQDALARLNWSGLAQPHHAVVERDTQKQLEDMIAQPAGHIHLLGFRQVGKTTLSDRTGASLRARGYQTVQVDIAVPSMGDLDKRLSITYWDLATRIANHLGVGAGWQDAWKTSQSDDIDRLMVFFRIAVLGKLRQPLVIFLDEADTLLRAFPAKLGLPELMRRTWLARIDDHDFRRLVFVVIGSYPFPKDATLEGMAHALFVEDLTFSEFEKFSFLFPTDARLILPETWKWTNGHPRMTQAVLASFIRSGEIGSSGNYIDQIRQAVLDTYLGNPQLPFQVPTDIDYLLECGRRCADAEPEAKLDELLALYLKVLDAPVMFEQGDLVQRALRLAGLAKVSTTDGYTQLVPRNRIIQLHYSGDWARRELERIAKYATTEAFNVRAVTGMPAEDLAGMAQVVDEIFRIQPEESRIRWERDRNSTGEVLVSGCLYRFPMRRTSTTQAHVAGSGTLYLYNKIDQVGGELWEREVRAFIKLRAHRHSTLPEFLEGDLFAKENVAYLLSPTVITTLATPGVMEDMRRDPAHCFAQLTQLAEGLTLLNAQRVFHRNLWPGTLLARASNGANEPPSLQFCRFEMSSLLSNLLQRWKLASMPMPGDASGVALFFRQQGATALAHLPPERLAQIFPECGQTLPHREDFRGDVFSLAMIGYELLGGELPTKEIDCAFPDGGFNAAAYLNFLSSLHTAIDRTHWPIQLRELLRTALDLSATARPTPWEMRTALEQLGQMEGSPWARAQIQDSGPYLVLVMRENAQPMTYALGWEGIDVSSDEGYEHFIEILAEDLRGGKLTWFSDGHYPFSNNPQPTHKEINIGLVGQRLTYFANYYYRAKYRTRSDESSVCRNAIVIRYHTARSRTTTFQIQSHATSLPPLIFSRLGSESDEDLLRYPSWEGKVNAVSRRHLSADQFDLGRRLGFLLRLQEAQFSMRTYSVKLDAQNASALELDMLAEADRDANNPYRLVIARANVRSKLGDYFEEASANGSTTLRFYPTDDKGRVLRVGIREAYFSMRLDQDRVRVAWKNEHDRPIPGTTGRLQLLDDRGNVAQIRQQRQALTELLSLPDLMTQMQRPQRILPLRREWPEAGAGLTGDAPKHIERILNTWPFLAIQGPPGTGKTTLLAHAILESCRRDRGLRILVAAQSHYALDNLAERILRLLKEGRILDQLVVIRIASRLGQGKVAESMQRYQLSELTSQRIQDIQRDILDETLPKAAKDNLRQWQATVDRASLELEKRLLSGANLVFATTGTCTDHHLELGLTQQHFDWVIVEEAGKAWTTELILPMVRGSRWTLVGDHLQLSAFGRDEMLRILQHCETNGIDPDLEMMGRDRARTIAVWNFFENIFEQEQQENVHPRNTSLKRRIPLPVFSLTRQFRMRPAIAKLVSENFYDGKLQSDPRVLERAHLLTRPDYLEGRDLVWLDTSDLSDAAQEEPGARINRCEARLIGNLLQQMRPQPKAGDLALLSPYRDQVEFLRRHVPQQFSSSLHTVDAFQGREAEIVIISMVRFNNAEPDDVRGRLGFLDIPNRINVLFSRARLLLIIVGALPHFEATTGTFWNKLCTSVRNSKMVVPASEVD